MKEYKQELRKAVEKKNDKWKEETRERRREKKNQRHFKEIVVHGKRHFIVQLLKKWLILRKQKPLTVQWFGWPSNVFVQTITHWIVETVGIVNFEIGPPIESHFVYIRLRWVTIEKVHESQNNRLKKMANSKWVWTIFSGHKQWPFTL